MSTILQGHNEAESRLRAMNHQNTVGSGVNFISGIRGSREAHAQGESVGDQSMDKREDKCGGRVRRFGGGVPNYPNTLQSITGSQPQFSVPQTNQQSVPQTGQQAAPQTMNQPPRFG